MDGAAKHPLHPELQPTARRQNRTAADRNLCFTDLPAKLQTVWTSMVFLALNFLHMYPFYILPFTAKLILSHLLSLMKKHPGPCWEAPLLLSNSFILVSPTATQPQGAVVSGALHISQCRQERSLGVTLFPHPTETTTSAWKQTSCKSKNYRGTK